MVKQNPPVRVEGTGTISKPLGGSIEQNIISTKTSGVMQNVGGTTTVYHFAEPEIKEVEQAKQQEISPKLAEGVSGYYIKSPTYGVYVPASKGVADMITASNAKAAQNMTASAAITPSHIIIPNLITTDVGLKTFNLPQTYTASTSVEEQARSLGFRQFDYSPETVGWEKWQQMENIRLSNEYQTAFMFKKLITGEGLYASLAGAAAVIGGKYPEYQKSLQERWTAEQRAETYQMTKFGEKVVSDATTPTIMHDVYREQFMQQKFIEIVPPAVMWAAPAFAGKILGAAVGAAKLSTTAAQTWGKIGVIATGGIFTYGASETIAGFAMGTPEGYERAARGFVVGGFAAYGLKQMWQRAFPKKYYIQSYKTEYQMYSGEEETLRGEFNRGYQNIQSYRYGSPLEKLPKQTMPDEAVYVKIKGYKTTELFTGDKVVNEFEKSFRFRIAEHEGLYKPLMQNIKEINVFYPKFAKGQTIRNLGVNYYDTMIGKPDTFSAFTFSKTGASRVINIGGWESSFQTLESNIPISTAFVKGTGYETFQNEFRSLLRNMVADKSLVITEASYQSFFLEPDTRQAYTSFAVTGKHPIIWKTTGDYMPIKQDLFDVLGIKDLTKVGGISHIDLIEGRTFSVDTILAERLKTMQKLLYDYTMYDKPVIVLANYPPETSLTLIPPTIVGKTPPVLYGMSFTGLKGEAGLGLKPQVKEFTQPELRMVYEPKLKELPYSMPQAKPELSLRAEPALILQPKLQPMLKPALELQPKLEMRQQPMLQLRTQLRLEMKPELIMGAEFKEKPNIFYEEEGKDWFRGGKKDIFGISKKDRLRKERFKIEPKSDWLSRIESEMLIGKATNVPNTPKMRKRFKQEFLGHPLGMFAGRMPTQEMIKREKWIWVK